MAKILLVEDDTNLREIFDMRLKAEGYQTLAAGDGEEGLVVAMKEKPELIIADVMMPKLSGFEMLETLFAAPEMAGTKAVMMTALGQPEDRARGEKLGVVKYLVKSQVTLEDFVRVVKEVLSPETPSTPQPAPVTQVTNQESEVSMPEDPSTTPPAPSEPTGDSSAGANPISTPPSVPAADQPSAAQEQSAVQDQINNFVANPAPADPAAPAGMDSSAVTSDSPTPGMGTEPAAAPAEPSATPADTPAENDIPMSTPPAEEAPTPPADNGQDPAPSGTL